MYVWIEDHKRKQRTNEREDDVREDDKDEIS